MEANNRTNHTNQIKFWKEVTIEKREMLGACSEYQISLNNLEE